MIEVNGWVVIRESYNEEGEDDELLDEIIAKIKAKISQMNIINEIYHLKCLNGFYHLMIMANHNHRAEHIFDFYEWISRIATGSYGVLYVHDNEDSLRGNENQFKILCMKKGNVIEFDDELLSPVIPEIEE